MTIYYKRNLNIDPAPQQVPVHVERLGKMSRPAVACSNDILIPVELRGATGLGFGWRLAVQPGCTNLGLGSLLHSPTNADDQGRIGCSQGRAKTEYKWKMESVPHTMIIGEHKTNVNSLQSCGTMSSLEVHHREFRSHSGADADENLIRPSGHFAGPKFYYSSL
jgi:hypothetical protein